MDLELTEPQRAARDVARRFAREKLDRIGVEVDRTHQFPRDAVAELGRLGMLGVFIPEKYGGAGLDNIAYALVIEELSVECASTGVIVSAHSSLGSWPILGTGDESQRQQYLPKMATGEWLGCFALTEPQAGSDAAGQKTRAVRDGDWYVINGTKNFITNGPEAGVCILFANTAPDQGHHGISAFVVETAWPGFHVVRTEDKMGIHAAHSAQLSFSDLRVPRENLLAGEGDGFKVAMKTLDGGRIGIAAQAVGIARASLEASLKYAQERKTFGNPLASYQAIQWKLADMAVEVDAARLLTLQYTKEFKVERFFRDAKITEIYEGTSEIQRLVISAQVLQNR